MRYLSTTMNFPKVVPFLFLGSVLTGCSKSAPTSASPPAEVNPAPTVAPAPAPAPTPAPVVAQVPTPAQPAPAVAVSDAPPKDYAFTDRDQYVQDLQGRRDELVRQFSDLAMKGSRASVGANDQIQPTLDAVRTQNLKLDAAIEKVKNATAATWPDSKSEAERIYLETKQTNDQASTLIDAKLAADTHR